MPTTLLMPQKRSRSGHRPAEPFIEERLEGAGDTFLVPLLDGYLYYSPLAGVSMLLDAFGAATVKKHYRQEILSPQEQALIDELAEQGVFQSRRPQQEKLLDAGSRWMPTSVTFSNTQKCTLRCKYCYAEGGRLEDLDIPWPVAKAAIDLIVKNAITQQVNPSVSFLGEGEATASWSVFQNIVEYFKERCRPAGLTATVSLSTNGVFPSTRLDYLAENCTHVTFSLDGVREVHDENRVLPSGSGSFDRIIATMKGFEERGKAYDIRSTVTAAGSVSLVEFVQFIGEHLQCKSIHFEPVFDSTEVTNLTQEIDRVDAQTFVTYFRRARQIAAGFGIELYYSGAATKHRETFCGASYANTFLITSAGIVTSCNEVLQPSDPRAQLFHYGGWNQEVGEFVLNQGTIDRLGKLNVHEMPKCQGCIAKYNCAGDCYAKTALASSNGDPASAGYTERCYITRELLKDNLLLGLIAKLATADSQNYSPRSC